MSETPKAADDPPATTVVANLARAISRGRLPCRFCGTGLHCLVVTVALALVTLIVHHETSWLGWLDALAARTAAAWHGSNASAALDRQEPVPVAKPGKGDPLVLLITGELYESAFGERSPLDRAVLARLVEEISAQKPGALVIDLDVSSVVQPHSGEDVLDQALKRALDRHPVLLAVPQPTHRAELVERKIAWMRGLCEVGVQFGRASFSVRQGVVLYRDPEGATLYNLAAQTIDKTSHGWEDQPTPCALAKAGKDHADFLLPLAPEQNGHSNLLPLADPMLARADHPWIIPLKSLETAGLETAITGRVVFLGGAYDGRDEHLTPFGPRHGVLLHAAAYQERSAGARQIGFAGALGLDLLIGLLACFLFQALGHGTQPISAWATRFHGRPALVREPIRVGCNLIVLSLFLFGSIGLTGVLFLMSGMLLTAGMWLNPAAMIMGAALDALMAHGHSHSHGAGHHWAR